ncbi:MAG: YebC/PmpR family DNA-binding transcriptional regulator, partial [Candidatus Neomarinimicrobiota bacterium]
MSGHSKWATIKRKKSVTDAKRGKLFTKLIKEIMISARNGGGETDSNPRLRQALLTAKAANMPNDNIKRAIQKGTGELEGLNYEELTYEGYGPGGVAVFMEILTDNKKRTVAEIRHIMNKYGGNLGENGSVSWMFDKLGQIIIENNQIDEEKLFEKALESGAMDFSNEGIEFLISCSISDTPSLSEQLSRDGYKVISSSVEM